MEQKIYEVIDTSDDDMYFPLGIFLDFDSAKKAIEDFGEDQISDRAEEYEEIKIMERKVGWDDNGKEVFVQNRESYEDKDGETLWRRVDS